MPAGLAKVRACWLLLLLVATSLIVRVRAAPALQRIIGGTNAAAGRYPFAVSLRDGADDHFCTGTLISPYIVLTAQHCVTNNAGQLNGQPANGVAIGGLLLDASDGERRTVSQVVPHPNYVDSGNTYGKDLALLILDVASTKTPIQLAPASQVLTAGQQLTAIGWGDIDIDANTVELPNILQTVNLPYVARSTCGQAYSGDVTRDMICAGGYNGKDTCQGDSGGPLFYTDAQGRDIQVGITSWGAGCAEDYPGVYTNVPFFNSWILQMIQQYDPQVLPSPSPSPNPSPSPSPQAPLNDNPFIFTTVVFPGVSPSGFPSFKSAAVNNVNSFVTNQQPFSSGGIFGGFSPSGVFIPSVSFGGSFTPTVTTFPSLERSFGANFGGTGVARSVPGDGPGGRRRLQSLWMFDWMQPAPTPGQGTRAALQIKFAPDAAGLAAAQATLQALRLNPCSLFNCANGAVQVVADPLLRIGLPAPHQGDPCDCSRDGFSGPAYTETRGCNRHLSPQDMRKFCYVAGGAQCTARTANAQPSKMYPGAYWRPCSIMS